MKIADISHYEGKIDWELAREELDLVIFRASVGLDADNKYAQYAAECGVPYGVYHYVKSGTSSGARKEAQYFVQQARKNGLRPLFYVADIEHSTQTRTTVLNVTEAFLNELRALGCKKIGLYIPQDKYSYIESLLDDFDFIWIPRYGLNNGAINTKYKPIYPCELWQYTDKGKLAGCKEQVDLNVLNGTKSLSWFTDTSVLEKEEETMAEFTNLKFVEFCKKFVGQPYWYGTYVQPCTTSLLNSKKSQYSTHYTSGRMATYKKHVSEHKVCSDCCGLIKGYFWTNGGEGVIESIGQATPKFTTKYASNGMPDKSANDLFEYAKKQGLDWGTIDTIPELPGVAVRYSGHVGVYIGNGEVVEERGFNYGCVITKLKDRNWLHWYRIPGLKYVEVNSTATQQLGARLLKKGLKGDDVKELQHLLNELIGTNLVEDGDFGNATFEAVKKFQSKYGLNADGIYGEKSHLALMSAIADREPEPDEPKDEPIPVINGYKTTGSVNVRAGNSASYAILTTLAKNTKLEPLVNAQGEPLITDNGWYAISILGQIGWISGKYVGVM